MTAVLVMLGSFLIILILGVPIGISMAIAGMVTILSTGSATSYFQALAQKMYTGIDSFALLAIPFFLLAGNIMNQGGISKRLVEFFRLILRRVPATTAVITTITSAFFGALTGSSPATVAAVGGMTVPTMLKNGYTKEDASAVAAASGILGPIIPPSITMITFAVTASISISTMFLAGIVPGLMLALGFVIVEILCHTKYEKGEKTKLQKGELFHAFKNAVWALGMPVIILGGIYGGIFTPTEAAAVSCIYASVVSVFVYREVRPGDLVKMFYDSVKNTAQIMFILCLASGYAWLMANFGIIKVISGVIIGLGNKFLILLTVNVILLILGCFIDATSIIILVTPIMLPVADTLGIHYIALGLMMCVNVACGALTPPLAPNLYVAGNIAGTRSIVGITKAVLPLLAVAIIVLLILTYVPETTLFLPRILGLL